MAIYKNEKYSPDDSYEKPSDEINPHLKENDPEWSLQWSRYIYGLWIDNNTEITQTDVAQFERTRLYSQGKQPTAIYKDILLDEFKDDEQAPGWAGVDNDGRVKSGKSRKGFMNVNFDDVFSPLPKYVQTIIGLFEDQDHNIIATSIDENSIALKEDMKFKSIAKGQFNDYLGKLNEMMGIDFKEEGSPMPRNAKELELFDSLGAFKLKYEIGIQKALDHTFKASKLKTIKRQCIKDIINTGYIFVVDYMDYNIMEVRSRRVDPSNIIIERSESADFDDVSFFGEVHFITIMQLKHETGLSDDELYDVSLNWWGQIGNEVSYSYVLNSSGIFDFYNVKVAVLRSSWKSNDYDYKTIRKINGQDVEFPEPWRGKKSPKVHNKNSKQTYKNSTKTNYGACWVIGSEIVYQYGKLYDVAYDYAKKEVPLPIHAYRIDEIPLMQNCIVPEDQIMLTNIRLQNAIAKSPPPGLKIEYNALMGMTFNDDSEWQPLDMLKLYSQSGHLIYNISPDGIELPPNYPDPVTELRGGLGTAIQDAAQSFELNYGQLMELTGIDRISSVSKSPTAQQGKAVTEIAVSATNNTLRPVYASWISVKECLAKGTILRIQGLVYTRKDSPYINIIGIPAVAALKAAATKSPVQLGVHLVAAPDDMLKQEVRGAAQAALAGGKNGIPALKYSEYLFILESLTSMSGIQSARMYIAIKEAEREEQDRKFALESQENQGKVVMAENAEKSKQALAKIDKEAGWELQKVDAEKLKDIEVENVKHRNKMEQIRLEKSLEPERAEQT